MNVAVKTELKGFEDLATLFPRATASALNKTIAQAKTRASSDLREVYNIKKSDIDATMSIRKATVTQLFAMLRTTGKRIALSKFGARQVASGVAVMVKKGARKVIRTKFIATMKSGHIGVYGRKGRARLPIIERSGPSVPQLFGSRNIIQKLQTFTTQKLPEILDHEIQFFLSRKNG